MKNKTIDRRLTMLVILAGLLLGAAFVAAMALHGTPVLAQTSTEADDDDNGSTEGPDVPITGDALEKASAAALEYIGEGQVTGTEVGDEEGYYEVEITRQDGRQVDVHLDEAFNVLGHEDD